MKSSNYIQIQGWMVTNLKLSGNYLLAYALIYGFSQDGQSEFTGSIKYVCKWLGCSRPTAIKILKELTEQNLIDKSQIEVNNVTFNKYSANLTSAGNFSGGSKETLPPVKKLNEGSKETLLGGSKETLPNNTIINNTKNNDDDVYFDINTLLKRYNANDQLVKAFSESQRTSPQGISEKLEEFNLYLKSTGQFSKTWKDYTSHFLNWHKAQKRKTVSQKSPTDVTL